MVTTRRATCRASHSLSAVTPAELTVTAALGASFLTVCGSLGVAWFPTDGSRNAIFLGFHCPARRHRIWVALRASLRDGFANLDAAPTRKDLASVRKTEAEQAKARASRTNAILVKWGSNHHLLRRPPISCVSWLTSRVF